MIYIEIFLYYNDKSVILLDDLKKAYRYGRVYGRKRKLVKTDIR